MGGYKRKKPKISEETRQKLRESHKGYVMPESQKQKISLANKGGNSTSFKKGQTPYNKGKRMPSLANQNNPLWKGDEASYTALHNWVRKYLGTPERCEFCLDTRPRKYEWANKSHEYKRELSDWIRLCVPCHRKYDKKLKPVKQLSIDGELIRVWDCANDAAKAGFNGTGIGKCCKKLNNYNTANGFRWEYA